MHEIEALTDDERRLLEFEGLDWSLRLDKPAAIATAFGMSETRYYQWLNAVIDLPGATVEFPVLTKRLSRLRETRQRARSARRLTA